MTMRRLATGVLFSALLATTSGRAAEPEKTYKYDFGGAAAVPGFVAVMPSDVYSKGRGFGFEPGATLKAVDRGGTDVTGHLITSDKPFYFSVAVPEGNYRVTLTVGDIGDAATDLTVKAELRRLMVEKVHVDTGKTQKVSFVVNVRVPQYPGGAVRLKAPRESQTEIWAWDDKLTLEFNNAHPNIDAVEIEKVDVPTVYLVGDSTMCDQSGEPWNSWGQMFPRFFKDDVAIANHAESGETVASSLGAHRFDKVYSLLKPGDYVFWAFGHNDMKAGAVSLDTYKADYVKIVAEVRKRGATPVIVSSMERKGNITTNSLAGYPDAAKAIAEQENVAFIDLHAMSQQLYKGLGADQNAAFQDGTHNNNFGSYEMSKLVLEGLRKDKLDLVSHIREDVPVFDWTKPDKAADYHVPTSPKVSAETPLGN